MNLFGKKPYKYAAPTICAVQVIIVFKGHEGIRLSAFCPGDVCDRQLVECVNVDVTAAGCSHPVSSACLYQSPPPPHPPIPLLKLLRASLILILQTHLTVFIDFTILNIYRSHFPKPSMFIQHLGDHSPAPFSIPPPLAHPCYTHTQTLVFSFSLFLSSLPRPPSSLYYIPPLYVPLPG